MFYMKPEIQLKHTKSYRRKFIAIQDSVLAVRQGLTKCVVYLKSLGICSLKQIAAGSLVPSHSNKEGFTAKD